MTPEGKIKRAVSRAIAKFPNVYKFMPVPAGFGPSSLDYLLCVNGHFLAIETKAPGKKLTPRQQLCAKQITDAGGLVLVIDSEDMSELLLILDRLTS